MDYGCGKGNLVQYLRDEYPDVEVCGYDPAVSEYSKVPERKFDLITCTDVLEHIPEVELIESIEKISSMSEHVFFILHHGPAEAVLENGENAHCTIKPPEWYYDIFQKFFPYTQYLPAEHGHNTACITFKISETAELSYYRLTERAAKQEVQKLMSRNELLRDLLKANLREFSTPRGLVFYGFGYNSKLVYELVRKKCNVRCFVDKKKSGVYDGVKIFNIADFNLLQGDAVIVFPEYDFDAIKDNLRSRLNDTNEVFKASEFFYKNDEL